MRYEAVIFDLDGTLYDKSRLPLYVVLSDLGHLRCLKAERTTRKELMGKDFGTEDEFYSLFFAAAAAKAGVTPERFRQWYFGRYMPDMARILSDHYRLYPWVEEVFASLRSSGVKTAVFSDYSAVPDKLSALGFSSTWVDLIADAPSFGGLKPSEASFRRLAKAMGVTPSQCLMVGDRQDTDGEGALAAGMSFSLYKGEGMPSLD